MNFSVHLSDKLVEQLNQTARESGEACNALIHEAVGKSLVWCRPCKWPAEVMNFRGIRRITWFEKDHKELRPPRDPFDAVPA